MHKQDSNIQIDRTVRGGAYDSFRSGCDPLVGSCERGKSLGSIKTTSLLRSWAENSDL
jgi:hypothetical protein